MQAVHGVKWTGTSTAITTALLYGRLAVLAHLLSPKDFGLMGMVLVIVSIGSSLADAGISQAIIWKQDATAEQLSTLYWLNIMAGFAVFGITIAVAPLVSVFFGEPRLTGLIIWASFIFPVSAIGQQFQMLLQKDLRFRKLAVVEIISTALGCAVAITAAFLDQGVLSLVWGQLTISTCAALLYASVGWREWRPQFVFKPRNLHGVISFGLYQMGWRVGYAFAANVDYIVVGRFLGPRLLGIYMLAWQIMVAPMAKLNPALTRVAFPVFARKQADDGALSRGYVELSKMVAVLTLPIIVLAAATAPVFVPVVFGSKWIAAVPIIQIFVLLGLFLSLTNPTWSMFWARGRADLGLMLIVAVAAVSTVVFCFAAQQGLYSMAWAEVAVAALFFFVVLEILRRLIGLKYSSYFREVGKPTLLAFATGAATYGCYLTFRGAIHSNLWLFIVLLAFGILCYALLIILFERQYFLNYFWLFLGREQKDLSPDIRDNSIV